MGTSKAERTNEDKHQRILDAAIKVFAKRGFFNSRVSEIAKEAGVADGTIYLYFKGKDDLLISLFEESMDKFIRFISSELEKLTDPLEKIKKIIRLHFELVEKDQFLAEVITVELRQSSKFMKEYANIKFREYLKIISSLIKQGQEAGTIRKDVIAEVANRALFGALDEVTLQWVLSKKRRYSLQDCAEQLTNMFIKGIAT